MGGLFSNKKQESQQMQADSGEVIRDVTRRLRILEERINNDRKNFQLNQQNFISSDKKTSEEVKLIYGELSELKKEMTLMNDQLNLMTSALKDSAKKEDVKVIEKYIELWEPLNFVTRREVDALVRRILKENQP